MLRFRHLLLLPLPLPFALLLLLLPPALLLQYLALFPAGFLLSLVLANGVPRLPVAAKHMDLNQFESEAWLCHSLLCGPGKINLSLSLGFSGDDILKTLPSFLLKYYGHMRLSNSSWHEVSAKKPKSTVYDPAFPTSLPSRKFQMPLSTTTSFPKTYPSFKCCLYVAIKESVTLLHNSQLFVEMCVHVHMYMSGE